MSIDVLITVIGLLTITHDLAGIESIHLLRPICQKMALYKQIEEHNGTMYNRWTAMADAKSAHFTGARRNTTNTQHEKGRKYFNS